MPVALTVKKRLVGLLIHPFFSLALTAILMIVSQVVTISPKLSNGERNSLTIVIGFAGLSLAFGLYVHYLLKDTHNSYLDRISIVVKHTTIAQWDNEHLLKVLREMTPCDDREQHEDAEDLRIATTAFNSGAFPEELLADIIHKGVRVRVLLMDPENHELVRSRNERRVDETIKGAVEGINHQIERFSNTKLFPKNMFELRLSNLMPCGFLLHTRDKALLGLMLAHVSFSRGPMIEIDREAQPQFWETLKADWNTRWDAASPSMNTVPSNPS